MLLVFFAAGVLFVLQFWLSAGLLFEGSTVGRRLLTVCVGLLFNVKGGCELLTEED